MSLRLKWRGEGAAGELISFRFHCEPPSAARMCFPAADPGSRAGVSLSHAFTSGPAKPESLLLEKKKIPGRKAGDFGFAKPGCFLGELFLLWFSRISCADIHSNNCLTGAKLSDVDPLQSEKSQVGEGRETCAVIEELFVLAGT